LAHTRQTTDIIRARRRPERGDAELAEKVQLVEVDPLSRDLPVPDHWTVGRSGCTRPERSNFDGSASIEERLERLLHAAGTFIDKAQRIYRMWLREPMLTGPWAEKGAEYGARWTELMRTALGPLADEGEAMAILRGVLEPTFFDNVRGGTRTTGEAANLITSALVGWFTAREAAALAAGSDGSGRQPSRRPARQRAG
jgi:hypothetical protein